VLADLDRHLDLPERDLALEAQYATLRLSLLLNSALVALKVGGTSAAQLGVKAASRALRLDGDPEQVPMAKRLTEADKAKALYRRAMARTLLKEEKEAVEDLEEAAKLQPDDAAIRKECVLLRSLSHSLPLSRTLTLPRSGPGSFPPCSTALTRPLATGSPPPSSASRTARSARVPPTARCSRRERARNALSPSHVRSSPAFWLARQASPTSSRLTSPSYPFIRRSCNQQASLLSFVRVESLAARRRRASVPSKAEREAADGSGAVLVTTAGSQSLPSELSPMLTSAWRSVWSASAMKRCKSAVERARRRSSQARRPSAPAHAPTGLLACSIDRVALLHNSQPDTSSPARSLVLSAALASSSVLISARPFSTMTTSEAKCTVCQKPATTRCSACSREPFCSRSCRALVRPPPSLTFNLLAQARADSQDTLAALAVAQVSLQTRPDRVLHAAAAARPDPDAARGPEQAAAPRTAPHRRGRAASRWRGAQSDDGSASRAPRSYDVARADADHPLSPQQDFYTTVALKGPLEQRNLEHERLLNLLYANEFLDLVRKDRIASSANYEDPSDVPATPWEVLGERGCLFYDEYFDGIVAEGIDDQEEAFRNRTGQGFFNTLNGALRCELVNATMRAACLGPDPPMSVMDLHLKELRYNLRVREALDRADLPPRVRDRIKAKYVDAAHRRAQYSSELGLVDMWLSAQREAQQQRSQAQAP